MLVNGRGGFPLLEAFLGVVPAGTVRESMVTLTTRIELSKVSFAELRPGRISPASADP